MRKKRIDAGSSDELSVEPAAESADESCNESPAESADKSSESRAAAMAQRASNRTYMRRWRSNAKRRKSELARRMARYYERKARTAPRKGTLGGADPGIAVCAICSIRPSVRGVIRLRVSEIAPSGYEEVLMPYCGEC